MKFIVLYFPLIDRKMQAERHIYRKRSHISEKNTFFLFSIFFSLTLVLSDKIDHTSCFAKGFCSLHIYYVKGYCSKVQETAYKTKHWFNVLIPIAFIINFFLESKRVLKMFSLNDLLHIVYAQQYKSNF